MKKEEFLEQMNQWYDNSDAHYDTFVEQFSKDKEGLIELLALVGQSTSTTSVNAAKLFEPKSKEEWLLDILKPFNTKEK
jgi:hypothetical protein